MKCQVRNLITNLLRRLRLWSDDTSALRDQLTKLQALVGLSMVMTERTDGNQIARLASSAVSSLAPVRCDGVVHVAKPGLAGSGPARACAARFGPTVEKQLPRPTWSGRFPSGA